MELGKFAVGICQAIPMMLAINLQIALATPRVSQAEKFNPAPVYESFDQYTTTISGNNDIADIYYPKPATANNRKNSFPVALLLQGANVDKSLYSQYASMVARYGFVVIVPNHRRLNRIFNRIGLFANTSQINDVLTQVKKENSRLDSPVKGIINTTKLALLGHSFGGAVGLSAIADICEPVFCEDSFHRPQELVAGIFFGANLRNPTTNQFIPINNSGIPLGLIQGNLDGVAIPLRATRTYENIQSSPKALIQVSGTNHYGMTNINNPTGPLPDSITPTLAQKDAIETIARWSGLFLRANILKDRQAFNYVYSTGSAADKNVIAFSQTTPSQKKGLMLGIVISGISLKAGKGIKT